MGMTINGKRFTSTTRIFAPSDERLAGHIITNLLGGAGSATVIDIHQVSHSENAITWHRKNGHRVIWFSPFFFGRNYSYAEDSHEGVTSGSSSSSWDFDGSNASSFTSRSITCGTTTGTTHSWTGSTKWNLIDQVNAGCGSAPNDLCRQESVRFLADLMVTLNRQEPYFDNAAKSLLESMLTFVATEPFETGVVRERTMAEVWRLNAQQEPIEFKKTLAAMAKSPEDIVRQGACTMLHMEASREQFAAVKTVLIEHLKIWSFRRVQELTAHTDIVFNQLRDGAPTVIYLIVPPETGGSYDALVRVFTGWCCRELRTGCFQLTEHTSKGD
jgi:type IV secretory system conjugative DNA transfer VirD4/TraG family protein